MNEKAQSRLYYTCMTGVLGLICIVFNYVEPSIVNFVIGTACLSISFVLFLDFLWNSYLGFQYKREEIKYKFRRWLKIRDEILIKIYGDGIKRIKINENEIFMMSMRKNVWEKMKEKNSVIVA